MDLKNLCWNVQGCGDSRFLSAAKQFLRDNRPDVVVFMEPRICGKRADSVISALGFPYSYRIEAAGFSGEIWVACPDDRKGCASSSKPSKLFQNLIVDHALRDMGYSGPSFTWSRGQAFVRLDRYICNSYFDESFPEAIVHHLLRMRLDHRPILLQIGHTSRRTKVSPFRYFSGWISHSDFPRMVADNWLPEASMSDTIRKFTFAADTWNKTVFGYLATKKRIVMARLRGIQRYLSTRTSRFLSALEADLLIELEHLLDQEELLWKQKSRSDWISQGDRNTSYFHRRAISRRLRHKNSRIKLPDGMWCDDESILKEEAACFFKTLFADNDHPMGDFPISGRFPELSCMFHPTVIPHILCIRPPDESDMPDKPIWSLNAKNVFDIKSAYASLNSGTWEPESGYWKAIWSLQVPQRLRIFLWLSHKAKLMTNVERCRRSLSQQALCPCCHEFPETLLHVFRDCKYVIGVWSRLLPSRHLATFYSDDFRSWLLSNVATTVMHPTLVTPWHLFFASTLWQIWKNRNAWVFNGTMSNVADTVIRSLTWARYYAECTFKAPSSHSPIRKSTHWQRPERGWVSLCTDGAVSATSGIGSVSGVFRKDDGSWFYGFNKSIGIMQPLQAELWGLFIGIQIAWDIGLKKLLIQSDSKEAIKLLNAKDAASNNCALVRSIARLRNLRWETSIQWIPRTGNEPADMLAKFNNLPCYNTTCFAQPPERLWPLLDRDALSIM
ncbi:hypothetical protein GQ457_08G000230 [Hibiscus cannabinus]